MASLIIGGGLAATGAPGIVVFIGAAVGAYIDSEISKQIFEGEHKEPRLGGTPVSMANHGDPVLRVFGGVSPDIDDTGPRVPAMVVWYSDPYSRSTSSGSSKRGSAAQITWYADVALMFAGNWLRKIDRLVVDGETIFDAFPLDNLQFDVNFLGTTATTDGGSSGIVLDYISRQSFTSTGGGDVILSWVLIIKSNRGVDGAPVDEQEAAQLGRLRAGDLITLSLGGQPGGWPQRQSHQFGNENVLSAYRVLGVDTYPDGNVEVAVQLASFNGFESYVANSGPTVDSWDPGPIPTSAYPVFPSNLVTLNTLQIGVLRENWKQGALLSASPIEGVDWEFATGEDDGFQSTIVQDSVFGGLGYDTPFMSNRAVMYVKGFNLSAYGNRLPNFDGVARESQNLYPAHLVLELCHLAKISQRTARLRLVDFIDTTQPRASLRFPTTGGYLADRGVHIAEMDDFTTQAINLVNEGDPFFIHTFGEEIDFDTATVYRFAQFVRTSTGFPETFLASFVPRLDVDSQDLAITTFAWKTLPPGRVGGFVLAGQSETAAAIEKVCLAFNLELREHDAQIEVFDANSRDEVTVDPRDLQTRQYGERPDDPIVLTDRAESKAPSRVSVKFANQNDNGQISLRDDTIDGLVIDDLRDTADAGDVGPTKPFEPNIIGLGDLTLRTDQAHQIARRLLREARQRRFEGTRISLPSTYMHIQEGDLLDFAELQATDLFETQVPLLYGRDWKLLVDRVEIGGAGFRVEIEGFIIDEPTNLPPAVTPLDVYGGVNLQRCNALSVLLNYQHIFPIPVDAPLSDSYVTQPGLFIVAVNGAGGSCPEHTVATVLRSRDGSSSFDEVARVVTNGVAGNTRYPEGSLTEITRRATPGHFHEDETIRVRLPSGSLQSVTQQQAASGENFCLVGKELCTFTTAAQVPNRPREWVIKGFYRGWWGTSEFANGHNPQEDFVFLGNAREAAGFVAFVPLIGSDEQRSTQIKITRPGQSVNTAQGITVYPQMRNIRPLPVANLAWRYDGTDLTIKWDRMPRPRFSQLSGITPPKLAADEVYEVRITDKATGLTVFNTYETPDGATSLTYTAAQQATDGTDVEVQVRVAVRRVVSTSSPSDWREVIASVGVGAAGEGELEF